MQVIILVNRTSDHFTIKLLLVDTLQADNNKITSKHYDLPQNCLCHTYMYPSMRHLFYFCTRLFF